MLAGSLKTARRWGVAMARKTVKGLVIRPTGSPNIFKKKVKSTPAGLDLVQLPEAIPAELAGNYAVWSPDGLRIVGSGSTIEEALAIAALEDGRLVQRVPAAIGACSLVEIKPKPIQG